MCSFLQYLMYRLTKKLLLGSASLDQNSIHFLISTSSPSVSHNNHTIHKWIVFYLVSNGQMSFVALVCLLMFSYELHRQLHSTDESCKVSVMYVFFTLACLFLGYLITAFKLQSGNQMLILLLSLFECTHVFLLSFLHLFASGYVSTYFILCIQIICSHA